MKKIIANLIIILGIGLILYPFIGKLITKINQTKVITKYERKVNSMSIEDREEQKENYVTYNKQLSKSQYISDVNVIDVGNNIGYISIPKINVYLPIYEGTDDEILLQGIGHLENSSLPIRWKRY